MTGPVLEPATMRYVRHSRGIHGVLAVLDQTERHSGVLRQLHQKRRRLRVGVEPRDRVVVVGVAKIALRCGVSDDATEARVRAHRERLQDREEHRVADRDPRPTRAGLARRLDERVAKRAAEPPHEVALLHLARVVGVPVRLLVRRALGLRGGDVRVGRRRHVVAPRDPVQHCVLMLAGPPPLGEVLAGATLGLNIDRVTRRGVRLGRHEPMPTDLLDPDAGRGKLSAAFVSRIRHIRVGLT